MNKKKIALIGTDWATNDYRKENNAYGAITKYRLINPMESIQQEYDVTYFGKELMDTKQPAVNRMVDLFKEFDLVITKHVDNPSAVPLLCFASKHTGTPFVLDLDDNLWEVQRDNPGYRDYRPGSQRRQMVTLLASYAKAIFVSTEPLAEYIRELMLKTFNIKKDVHVLPNFINLNDFPANKSTNTDRIVIGWQGSTTHKNDLMIAMPALHKVMQENKNVYLEFLGGIKTEDVKEMFDGMHDVAERIAIKGGTPAWDNYPQLLSEQKWDIAIAPLQDNIFNQCKSHIKWLEYSVYSIPCIASKVYPYSESIQGTRTIENDVTGLLVKDDEWYDAITSLIENKEKLVALGKNSNSFVRDNWGVSNHGHKWIDAIEKSIAKN